MDFTNVGAAEVEINLGSLERMEENVKEAQKKLNERILADCTPLVPMDTGALRRSGCFPDGPYGNWIEWGRGLKPYARYQYFGEVYGPNHPITKNGTIVGWFSKGKRRPMGRELGVPGEWKGWRFGYTTADTKHHWFDEARDRHMNEWTELVRRTLVGR